MLEDRGSPSYQGDLSKQAVTIAEVLKESGYSTYMSGKWHVTPYIVDNPNKDNWPRQRGFDKFYGMISGAGSFYDPRSLALGNEYISPGKDFYATTNFTDNAVKYIEEHQSQNPYFLYVAYTAAHWPMHAPAGEVKKYKGYYDQGWDQIRHQRYERLKELGIVDERWPLTARDSSIMKWSDDIPDQDWEIANMEVYAAMIDIMDQGIGKIIAALEAKGELDNTLIFFLQDNGACAEELDWVEPQPAHEGLKPLSSAELQTKMIPYITRDGKPVKVMKDAWPGPPEGYTAYGLNWANASNTPFREYKHWVHEGGIATPLIVHWPSHIKSGGEFRRVPTHLIDIMATCIDAASAKYPSNYHDNNIIPLEGKSLLPVFDKQSIDDRAIFWEHEGNRAVRKGKWKLISKADKKDSFVWDQVTHLSIENWELYDMLVDRTETHDIATSQPEIVEELSNLWTSWAEKTGAIPRPDQIQ
jgi:arylsulfatase